MLLNERRAVSNTDANDVVILYIKFKEFGKRVRVALFLRLKNETKLETTKMDPHTDSYSHHLYKG